MLITLKKNASSDEVMKLRMLLDQAGMRHCVTRDRGSTVVGIENNLSEELMKELKAMPSIEKLTETTAPYKMASLAFKSEPTIIQVGDVLIGGSHVALIAGPCAIESEEQLIEVAEKLKASGVKILRASAFKPRTSPYSWQGLGLEGLKMHKRAQAKHGLLIESEVMDPRDVAIAAEHVDILRIGARNMQNFDLLKEVGKTDKPVILKRGMSATIEEWLMSAEYIMAHGNTQVILCERGIRTFEQATRNTLDLSSVAILRTLTHLPVIVDPSHAAGRGDIIPALSKAAVAVGADGLLIEVHPRPKQSACDARQALSPEEFENLSEEVKVIAKVTGRQV
ncbi:3-deoxy-7-phosphoheptulonate synthase [Simkania negevensis]|uniref:Phospho-2-dehydro-3-deoxyheptonate aldolase n=1 Tax=Simkania negevensis (strain ATCC VR-1471 / DSM 27360 / Z) TaxID=331113 RepID=F8L8E7_SIMNZ|nr:3-deoxy-7-phosphoheptulonate synthase [Simkania negevensis]CCB89070.1 phospho-2-dehydro-3-deoxyheptonate aldolase [Simkania negevensis Z]